MELRWWRGERPPGGGHAGAAYHRDFKTVPRRPSCSLPALRPRKRRGGPVPPAPRGTTDLPHKGLVARPPSARYHRPSLDGAPPPPPTPRAPNGRLPVHDVAARRGNTAGLATPRHALSRGTPRSMTAGSPSSTCAKTMGKPGRLLVRPCPQPVASGAPNPYEGGVLGRNRVENPSPGPSLKNNIDCRWWSRTEDGLGRVRQIAWQTTAGRARKAKESSFHLVRGELAPLRPCGGRAHPAFPSSLFS